MLALTRCALILGVLMKRKDADWFEKPDPNSLTLTLTASHAP